VYTRDQGAALNYFYRSALSGALSRLRLRNLSLSDGGSGRRAIQPSDHDSLVARSSSRYPRSCQSQAHPRPLLSSCLSRPTVAGGIACKISRAHFPSSISPLFPKARTRRLRFDRSRINRSPNVKRRGSSRVSFYSIGASLRGGKYAEEKRNRGATNSQSRVNVRIRDRCTCATQFRHHLRTILR